MAHRCFTAFFVILALAFSPLPACTHPHVFIDCALTFVFDETGLAGIRQRWTFGEMFSFYVKDASGAQDGELTNAPEWPSLKRELERELRDNHYFTRLLVNGEVRKPQSVENLSMRLEKDRLVYDFFVPCRMEGVSDQDRLVACVYDETYYKAMYLLKDAIRFEGAAGRVRGHGIETVDRFRFYNGQLVAKGVAVDFQRGQGGETGGGGEATARKGSLGQRAMQAITSWQKELKSRMTRFGRDIRKHPLGASLWLFLLLSFAYGALHALGPGHGKTIVCSYFLGRPGRYFHAFLMSNLITFTHVGSAVAVVLGLYFFLQTRGMGAFEKASVHMAKVSYGLLALLGLILLIHKIAELRTAPWEEARECGAGDARMKSLVTTAFVTGVVPCPGAAIILLFALTLKIATAGLLAMVCVAAGMGLTTTVFAAFTVASRDALFTAASRSRRLFAAVYTALSLAGALAIMVLGGVMFWAA